MQPMWHLTPDALSQCELHHQLHYIGTAIVGEGLELNMPLTDTLSYWSP